MEVFEFEPLTVEEFDWWWDHLMFSAAEDVLWFHHVFLAAVVGILRYDHVAIWETIYLGIIDSRQRNIPVTIEEYRVFFRLRNAWIVRIYGPGMTPPGPGWCLL